MEILKNLDKKISNWNDDKQVFFKLLIVIVTLIICNLIFKSPKYDKIKLLKKIEIILNQEDNKNKDFILNELEEKNIGFIKKYYNEKLLRD